MPTRARVIRLLLALLVAGAACSGTRSAAAGAADTMTIRVENNRPGVPSAQIVIVPEVGVRRQLGPVEAGRSAEFEYDGAPGNYQLVALLPNGELRSQTFRLFAGSTARWNMATGSVLVSGGR